MPDYLILTIDNCTYCDQAKDLIAQHGHSYAEVNCADHPEVATILGLLGRKTFPLVLSTVGGFTELRDTL